MKTTELLAAGVLLMSSGVAGTTEPKPVLALITKYQVKPADRESFRAKIAEYVTAAEKANGNIMAEAYEDRGQENIIWTIERWDNPQSHDQYQHTDAAKALAAAGRSALAAPEEHMQIDDLEPLSKTDWRRRPNPEDHPFTAMLILRVKPGTEDEFKKIYHTAMPKFRGEAGVVTYQLSQNKADKTQFITYEKFRGDDAFQFHLKFPPINRVINFLRTSIQDPPFEKGLHNLIEFGHNRTK